ncbi:MAG: 3-deoxy-manno-octulosonate cytidylyltransferase [Coxiellaceae bacterium]|nr:3-deoxy-manno-octulosonate cytidylyltransferase [Coxiellaceae bacterium]
MTEFNVIIPTRYASTRLPGKMLMDIAGKPMVQHAYERAKESGASRIIIAVDDDRLAEACEKFGATVCMTATTHQTGTERISEVVAEMGFDEEDIIVGLQADEPLIPPQLIRTLADNLIDHHPIKMATLATPLKNAAELFNPNVVKVQLNYRNVAMTFSRAPIPWDRDQFSKTKNPTEVKLANAYYRHIGLYAYRAGFLETYVALPTNLNETLESLEQLRVLFNGYKIHVGVTNVDIPPGVDTQEDLDRVREFLRSL